MDVASPEFADPQVLGAQGARVHRGRPHAGRGVPQVADRRRPRTRPEGAGPALAADVSEHVVLCRARELRGRVPARAGLPQLPGAARHPALRDALHQRRGDGPQGVLRGPDRDAGDRHRVFLPVRGPRGHRLALPVRRGDDSTGYRNRASSRRARRQLSAAANGNGIGLRLVGRRTPAFRRRERERSSSLSREKPRPAFSGDRNRASRLSVEKATPRRSNRNRASSMEDAPPTAAARAGTSSSRSGV